MEEKKLKVGWVQLPEAREMPSFSSIMDQVIEDSSRGWEHIIQNIVELGFLLVDSGRMIMVRLPLTNKQGKYYPDIKGCPYGATQEVGRRMLIKVYESAAFSRAAIVDQCINRVEALSLVGLNYLDLVAHFVRDDLILHSTRVWPPILTARLNLH
jgi:hypothetical protein